MLTLLPFPQPYLHILHPCMLPELNLEAILLLHLVTDQNGGGLAKALATEQGTSGKKKQNLYHRQ